MKRLSRHFQHYLPLLGIFVCGILGFYLFSYDKIFQAVILLATATSYVAWGIVHHHIHDDLHLTTVIEYLMYAVLGLTMVYSLLF